MKQQNTTHYQRAKHKKRRGKIGGAILGALLFGSALAPTASAGSSPSAEAGADAAVPPSVEELIDGYQLKPGLDGALYSDLQMLSSEYIDDVLKVTGTFGENALFGGRNDFNIYLPPAKEFEGRFFQRTYPFDTGNLPDDLKFSRSSGGYQVEYYELFKINGGALAADISRTVAANYYGLDQEKVREVGSPDYIYGYAYGGSGGSPTAIDVLEDDTFNTWDGAIAYVITAPYTYSTGGDTIPIFRNLLLRGLGDQIWDAIRVGGIGRDALYASLTPLQKEALEELELLGLRWEDIGNIGTELKVSGGPTLPQGYVEDFWTKPGYTGTEDSLIGEYFREVRGTTIDGTVMTDELLATIAWHRHRNFDPALGLFMYDHLSHLTKAGPQESAPRYSGDIKRKGMLVQNMQDGGAIYVSAEWYKRQVASKGKSDDFRVYVQEAAGHLDGPNSSGGDVPYLGLLEQALRDLSSWVENDREPAKSTGYDFDRNQIYLKNTSAERHGLQPVIQLTADGSSRALVEPNKVVNFSALIEPAVSGDVITKIEWNPIGKGNEWRALDFDVAEDGTVSVKMEHQYVEEKTFFPALRVTAYRHGAPAEGIVGNLMNQVSVRVIVDATNGKPESPVDVDTALRCVAGKVAVVASITNNEDFGVKVKVGSEYGSQNDNIQGGKTVSKAFSTRKASIDAGEISVTADWTTNGVSNETALTSSYDAFSCQ